MDSMEDMMRFRSSIVALAVSGALFTNAANAQVQMFDSTATAVRMFDAAPTQEQLRNILIPDEPVPSVPSVPRSIVITRPDVPKSQPARSTTFTTPAESVAGPHQPQVATFAKPSKPTMTEEDKAANAVAFRINFAFNSAVVPQDSIPYLEAIADLLKQEPKLSLSVEGHTDAVGGDDYNFALSMKRAEAVASYLLERGVAGEQLMPIGRGKSEPLVTNPYDGRNRRVQFSRLTFKSTSS